MDGVGTCPICGFSNIPEDQTTCPQCDADLVCFRLLEEGFPVPAVPGTDMPETEEAVEQAAPSSPQNNTGTWGRGIGICAAVMVILAIILISWAATRRLAGLAGSVAALDARLGQVEGQVEGQVDRTHEVSKDIQSTAIRIGNQVKILERRIERMDIRVEKVAEALISVQKKTPGDIDQKEMAGDIPAAPEPCMEEYQAKDTDTLWGIARDLLGSGIYYPVLMACNPDLNIFTINRRDRLKYPCDKTTVLSMYRQITAVKQNRRYWKYTVRPGDTPQSVADRYCSDKNNCFVSGFPFKTGNAIGIFLE